jgi:hypothetical protein
MATSGAALVDVPSSKPNSRIRLSPRLRQKAAERRRIGDRVLVTVKVAPMVSPLSCPLLIFAPLRAD